MIDNDNDYKLGGVDPTIESEELELTDVKAEIIMEAIQQLSPSYRAVFNLYVMDDYSHKQIAEALGISEGTSKSNLSKARYNIQKMVESKFLKLQ